MAGTPDPRVGTDLGSYHIEAVVGRGGMGVVYRAVDRNLDRRVALKLIAPLVADDEAFRSRFLRESKMAAAIDHPNILPVYEAGERDGVFFLATRFVDGTDLEHRLREGPLSPRAAVAILGQIASALDAAHEAGLVHRDVKPANMLIASGQGADRSDHAYLTDFGLTKQSGAETGLTRAGGFVGTLEYIAPEQIRGSATDGRADQYALAAIAVACLTGQAPFPRDSDVALINAQLHDPPPSLHARLTTLPPEVDAVIARGMAKDPAARYPDCRTFVDELRDALGITSTHDRPIPSDGRPRDLRIPLVIGGLVVGMVIVAGLLVASGGGGGDGGADPSSGVGSSVPPTSTSLEASPTEDVFPSGEEQALLDVLPPDIRDACVRGPYNLVEGDAMDARPIASLACPRPVASGADEVLVRRFLPAGGGGAFTTDSAISAVQAYRGIASGDCATSRRGASRYQVAGKEVALVCYVDSSNGDSILYWSYQDDAILVKATNRRGDSAALYTFFEQTARFIGQ